MGIALLSQVTKLCHNESQPLHGKLELLGSAAAAVEAAGYNIDFPSHCSFFAMIGGYTRRSACEATLGLLWPDRGRF